MDAGIEEALRKAARPKGMNGCAPGCSCRTIDQNPAYIDVAIERWEKATAKEAVLDGGGTFAEVASVRGRG